MLHFRLGPFLVLVYPWFFLSAILLGGNLGFGWKMAAWIFVVFVSVLVHELGHAIVGKLYGGAPEIHLQAFGGVTFPRLRSRPGPGRQFILSLAGPVFGLLLGVAAFALLRTMPPSRGSPTDWTMHQFLQVSIIWAVFNLLPILPLDGGNMLLAFLEGVRKRPSIVLASWLSFFMALAVGALVTLEFGFDPFLILWFGLFAFQNLGRARAARVDEQPREAQPQAPMQEDGPEKADVDSATDEARAALQRRDVQAALASVARLEGQGGPFRQAAALRLRAGIELARGDNEAAALFAGQSFSLWQSPDAAVVAARANLRAGAEDRARNWLRRAVEAGASMAAVQADPELGALA
ncbi:MAG TPA: M50 family metallopeptidase [Myxococcales bacterium]|nr:M50 family metallopeptidase [Myxococcales bacterium]